MMHVHSNPSAVAAAAAGVVDRISAEAQAARGVFRVGLSGGTTPEKLYSLLASPEYRSRLDWTRAIVCFADERAVPPDHPDSNYGRARTLLIDPLGIAPERVHRMIGESPDLEAAALEYETHLREPLDLLILGIGPDGHTASIFPGTPLVHETVRRVAAVVDSPKPPACRITVTPRVLGEAREVMMLATGEEKAEAVAAALADAGDPLLIPAALVRERDWYLDRASASRLSPQTNAARRDDGPRSIREKT